MNDFISSLPPLITLNSYGGDWDLYINEVYSIFRMDFVENTVFFKGKRVALKKHPQFQDKEYVFWHLTSEGNVEEQRTPDFRRCERIGWIKPIIENVHEPCIKFWRNMRRGKTRACLWLEKENYLVVLEERAQYALLWTAYLTERNHTQRKLRKEYETYAKNN